MAGQSVAVAAHSSEPQVAGRVIPLRRSLYKGPKKANIHRLFNIFPAVFPNIWPLAGPNIAKKGWPLRELARVDRQTHFGTFNFWLKPGF